MDSMEANKVVAAVLVAGIVFFVTGLVGDVLVRETVPKQTAIRIEVAQTAAPGPPQTAALPPIAPLLAKADPAAGGGASHDVTPKSQYINRIVIDKPARAIDVTVDGHKMGASLGPAPRIRWIVAEDGATWSCQGAGVPDKYLPTYCRH